MLESIRIQNFQGHKDLTVEFDPAITIIQGPNDAGKSSILRALRAVLLNKFPRRALHRGTKHLRLKLGIDGSVLVRRKGDGKNTYSLDGDAYQALGVSMPSAVSTLVNCDDINFQGQFDAPFWFGDTPGTVAKRLNALVDLQGIDKALYSIGSKCRKAKTALELSEERANVAKEALKELEWIPLANKDLQRIEQMDSQKRELEQKQAELFAITTRLAESIERRDRGLEPRLMALASVLEAKVAEWKAEKDRLSQLSAAIAELERLEETKARATSDLKEAEKELGKVKTCPVCQRPMK